MEEEVLDYMPDIYYKSMLPTVSALLDVVIRYIDETDYYIHLYSELDILCIKKFNIHRKVAYYQSEDIRGQKNKTILTEKLRLIIYTHLIKERHLLVLRYNAYLKNSKFNDFIKNEYRNKDMFKGFNISSLFDGNNFIYDNNHIKDVTNISEEIYKKEIREIFFSVDCWGFEILSARCLEKIFRPDKIKLTKRTRDGGLDIYILPNEIINRPIFVECKYWETKISKKVISDFMIVLNNRGVDDGLILCKYKPTSKVSQYTNSKYINIQIMSINELIDQMFNRNMIGTKMVEVQQIDRDFFRV